MAAENVTGLEPADTSNEPASTEPDTGADVPQEGDFQGKCILEPTKPGEEVLLIHAKETGVRVFKEAV